MATDDRLLTRDELIPADALFQSPIALDYAKTVDKDLAEVHDHLTYNLVITNSGGPTTQTLIIDQLPAPVIWLGTVTATYGTPGYDPNLRRIGWIGSLQAHATLIISWSVTIVTYPYNPGQVITNSFVAVSDSTAVATRFVETYITTPTPTSTATPTSSPTHTPTATSTATASPTSTSTSTPTATVTPTVTPIPTVRPPPFPWYFPAVITPVVTTTTPQPGHPPLQWPKFLPETGSR